MKYTEWGWRAGGKGEGGSYKRMIRNNSPEGRVGGGGGRGGEGAGYLVCGPRLGNNN
jgi:hypothetical protein